MSYKIVVVRNGDAHDWLSPACIGELDHGELEVTEETLTAEDLVQVFRCLLSLAGEAAVFTAAHIAIAEEGNKTPPHVPQ